MKPVDWYHILNQLRRQYKPISAIAREVGCCRWTLMKAARSPIKNKFTYEIGVELMKLYEAHCHDR